MKNTLDSQPSMMTMVACLMQFDSITKWIRNIIPSIKPSNTAATGQKVRAADRKNKDKHNAASTLRKSIWNFVHLYRTGKEACIMKNIQYFHVYLVFAVRFGLFFLSAAQNRQIH